MPGRYKAQAGCPFLLSKPSCVGSAPTTGVLSFLFTDIEGSTKLWQENQDAMSLCLGVHDDIVRGAVESNAGHVFKTVGDAFCCVFEHPRDALSAALMTQRNLAKADFSQLPSPIRVRIAIHSGDAEARGQDYFGNTLNRLARIMATGHGGQVLLSAATHSLLSGDLPDDATTKSLGAKRLKDLASPVEIFQLLHPDLEASFPPIRSLDLLPNNLPQQITTFIGRQTEIGEIKALLKSTRLVTLVGSGGAGKTRLALQVAAELLDSYTHGVWFVELAPLTDPGLVVQTVAAALGIKPKPGTDFGDALADGLKTGKRLLILDNCEHLLDSAASLCNTLLRSCPELSFLASSREGLGIAGEHTYRVRSLSVPEEASPTAAQLVASDSVTLFVDRSTLANQSFQLSDQNASAVASICRRLDGIPLAIELAAARVRSLSVEQLATRLDDRFRVLTGGSRTALPRQQTLRALIDWSYDLLSEPEQLLLQRLSVYVGGWSLDAAEVVCSGEPIEEFEVLDLLASLADKSLVTFDGTRYTFLDTIRQYSRDRLMENGTSELIRNRHAEWFHNLAQEAADHLHGSNWKAWLDKLIEEQDNLWATLEWLRANADSHPAAVVGYVLGVMLQRGGRSQAAIAAIDAGLALAPPASNRSLRANLMYERGGLHFEFGESQFGRDLTGQARALFEADGDMAGVARSDNVLGQIAMGETNFDLAAEHYERSLKMFRQIHDDLGVSKVLNNQALAMRRDHSGDQSVRDGRLRLAEQKLTESLQLRTAGDDRHGSAETLINLGVVTFELGDHARAWDFYLRALRLEQSSRHLSGLGVALANLGEIAELRQDRDQAARLYSAAEKMLAEVRSPLLPTVSALLEKLVGDDVAGIRPKAASLAPDACVDWALESRS